jgi:hypothetical protein
MGQRDLITRDIIYNVYKPPEDTIIPFPFPQAFDSEDELTSAAMKWFNQLRSHFRGVYLPRPISCQFHVASGPKVFSDKEKNSSTRFRTFQPEAWPLFPANYLTMLELLADNTIPFEPSDEFKVQIPKRDPIQYRHHITKAPQWQSQLFLMEPDSQLFNKYEDFLESYENWYSTTLPDLTDTIIPCDQFNQLLGVNVIRSFRLAEEEMSDPKPFNVAPRFAFVSKLKPPKKLDAIVTILKTKPDIPPPRFLPDDIVQVFGIELSGNNFVCEIENFGYGRFNQSRPNHPIGFVPRIREPPMSEIRAALQAPNCTALAAFRYLLGIDMPKEILSTLMLIPLGDQNVVTFLTKTLNIELIRQIDSWRSSSPQHPVRTARLLRAVLTFSPSTAPIEPLRRPENINDLDLVVRILARADTFGLPVIAPLATQAVGIQKAFNEINRFYLLSLFLWCLRDVADSTCANSIFAELRGLGFQVAKQLQNRIIQFAVRKEDVSAMIMLLRCDSPHVHRVLLGPKFLVWINELTATRVGELIVSEITHGPALESAALIFLRDGTEMLNETIPKMTTVTLHFVCALYDFIHIDGIDSHYKLRGDQFLTALELVNATRQETVATILVHIGLLLAQTELLENFMEKGFQNRLGTIVRGICQQVAPQESDFARSQMRTLSYLGRRFDTACLTLAQHPGFLDVLAAHLVDKRVSHCAQSWALLFQISADGEAQKVVLENGKIQEMFRNLPSSTHRYGLIRLLEYGLWVLTQGTSPNRKAFCAILQPECPRLAYLYATRNVTHFNDQVMVIALEKFCGRFKRSKWSTIWEKDGTEEFAAGFKKQLDAVLASLGLGGESGKLRRSSA